MYCKSCKGASGLTITGELGYSMHFQMSFQSTQVCKCLSTLVALERLLPRVDILVGFQIELLRKSLSADVAGKGFLDSVLPFVLDHGGRGLGREGTVSAPDKIFSVVCTPLVSIQALPRREQPAAVAAGKLSYVCSGGFLQFHRDRCRRSHHVQI